ncbi:MAG: DUF3006 domain-containing protein [Oscillospiraceae bacterium]|nr:DUF3006 domain-containing protein [Oscillospiraceae bacterium]MBQ3049010.1 DUF3006 domain-containing protein [Oscillospiraceae bacterium]MBQ9939158.1 DUF3006 domain-containing protein [Oscillospiraceae bacterium]
MKKLIVDRIEVGVAVCENEDGGYEHISVEKLPEGVKEGDCIVEKDGVMTADETETAQRRERMRSLMMRAMRKNKE